jgi:hypothetical protein
VENDLKEYLEQAEDTLATNGFRRLEQEFKEAIEALKEQMVGTNDNNELHFLRGQIAGYRRFLSYRILVENGIKQQGETDGPEL